MIELCGVLSQEFTEPFYYSVSTFEFDGALLFVAWGKIYYREAFHFEVVIRYVIGCAAHLGDHQIFITMVLFGQSQIIRL